MEPVADGFRNYLKTRHSVKTEELLLDRASLLGLSGPEMIAIQHNQRAQGGDGVDSVSYELRGRVAWVGRERPQKRNAINMDVLRLLSLVHGLYHADLACLRLDTA